MEDLGCDQSVSIGNEERVPAVSMSSESTSINTTIAGISIESPDVLSSATQTSASASIVKKDGGDSLSLQRLQRSKKSRKSSKSLKKSSSDHKHRKNGTTRSTSGIDTPSVTPPEVSAVLTPALEPERPLLSDSQWETEIAEFGTVLNNVLHCVTNRELVTKTAEYMASFPQHSLRFQIKIKQRAYSDGSRGFQAKLMLFYVLHEFLKSFEGKRLQQIQREWYQTIDEVLNACAREIRYGDKRNMEENRKRVFKTLARWEELKLYPTKIKAWKCLVMGEYKPRRAPVMLPRSETERQAEAPDQLQSFELPPPSTPQVQLDRSNCPLIFERQQFDTKSEQKQHWRYTSIAFIDILSRCLGLSNEIALTACIFFHRVFDRGIYAKERYKFAAACLFLSAKASSKRMKLLRMVRIMYDILETPLFAGDEELLEVERLQLLHYEMEVLQGINFELTNEMPFYYLRLVLEKMPDKFRKSIDHAAQSVLEDLFYLSVCVNLSPRLLGEAAAYIATWDQGKDFKFKWCSSSQDGQIFNERIAKNALQSYRILQRWKKSQQTAFDAIVKSASALDGDEAVNLKFAFKDQLGGLRLDPSVIVNELEFTKLTTDEVKDWSKGSKTTDRIRRENQHDYNSKTYQDDNEVRIKMESRSRNQECAYRYGRSDNRDRHRQYSRSRSGSDSRYSRGSGITAKHQRRDRYDYDSYDGSDRYRDQNRSEDKYRARDKGSSSHVREIDYYRDSSYFDRRDRKSGRSAESSRREHDSRSNSRSRTAVEAAVQVAATAEITAATIGQKICLCRPLLEMGE
ncbi:Cyclin, N-terminal [Plasmopara halstedii]|uniref:Cyclin, N-terminal n=1 Tax=Plasmopara halstedii TaxID=4781 RepID=A0A0P1AMS2_PLAHL|nr:Cyclin, N-terminal [Plasmopara halstedii]CEG42266.1 Cyclin, N-terminal [Plasmopara halstedii]|eukprot:XP_024578635.1 Cyclin, N-terminal [Plasmopara halstedii]